MLAIILCLYRFVRLLESTSWCRKGHSRKLLVGVLAPLMVPKHWLQAPVGADGSARGIRMGYGTLLPAIDDFTDALVGQYRARRAVESGELGIPSNVESTTCGRGRRLKRSTPTSATNQRIALPRTGYSPLRDLLMPLFCFLPLP